MTEKQLRYKGIVQVPIRFHIGKRFVLWRGVGCKHFSNILLEEFAVGRRRKKSAVSVKYKLG